ncbi:uncharacterized protein DUF222 [Williamsia muralis]|nr:uncharacterized protein DUF222 [Williamsia marianensis]
MEVDWGQLIEARGDQPMTDTTSLDPPATPVLMGLYRDLSSVLDRIAGASSSDLDDASACELARMNEKAVRALGFQGLQRLLEVSDRGAFRKAGHPTLHRFVMSELRVTRGDASSRLKALDAVARLHSLQGEVLPPKCPAAAKALAEGVIGLAHMDVMLDVRKHIPSKAAPEVLDVVDAWMVDNARTMNPTDLIQCGREVLARVDPDGALTDEQDRKRNRGLSVGDQGADLMAKITGTLDPQTLALFKTVLDVWAAPGMNNPDDPDSPVGAVDDPGHHKGLIESAAHRDTRTTAQRQHDAFKAILRTVLEYKLLGTSHRGLPAQVIITMTKQQLDDVAGIATTASGVDLPVKDALELAARSDKSLAVFAHHSAEVLYFARAKRVAQQGQRLALFAAYRGCSHPGCRQPATWAEIHHVNAWILGGLTNVDELVPACPAHHAMIGDGPDQWQTVILTKGTDAGRVAWIPPACVDPDQVPRVNRASHVGETVDAEWAEVIATRDEALREHEHRLMRQSHSQPPDLSPEDPAGGDDEG